jgi:hypothetical protein
MFSRIVVIAMMIFGLSAGLTGCGGGGGGGTGSATLQSIAVTPASVSINTATTQQLTATGTFSDGSKQNLTAKVTWASTNPTNVTVDTAGLVSGVAVMDGVAITASLGAATGTSMVSVTLSTKALIGIAVSAQSMWIGQKFDLLAASANYSNNTGSSPYMFVTWTSSNPAVATVDQGVWTALSAGTTTMTATSGTFTASNTLTVTAPPLSSITVLPATPTIASGATMQMTAMGIYADANLNHDITSSVAWSSSNPAAVTVSAAGLARGVAAGSATISATYPPGLVVIGTLVVTGSTLATVPATTTPPTTVTLRPTNDNTIMYSSTNATKQTTVFPTGTIAVGCSWNAWYNGIAGMWIQDAVCAGGLVQFNVATLAGKTIVSATLRLQTNLSGVGYVPRTWFVYALASPWSGTTVTWDSASAPSFLHYTASQTIYNPPTSAGQIYNIDQTNTVRNWVSGAYVNNGLEFGLTSLLFPYATSLDAFDFFSSEDPSLRGPQLIVTYQ